MKRSVILSVSVIGLLVLAMSGVVYAQTIQIQVGSPSNSNGDLGIITSSGYWIGEFPITTNPGTPEAATGEAYCMTPAGTIYEGAIYQATGEPVADNSTWQEISYILSWNTPTTNNEAAIDQVAIWMLLGQNPPYTDFNLDSSITSAAASLVSSVTAGGGLNVALQGDQLEWISPFIGTEGSINTTIAEPGQTLTFKIQLTDSALNALNIPNVQIDFNAFGSTTPEYTNSNGIATYQVTVPQNTPDGSQITITASTQSVWPTEYLYLTGQPNQGGTQNLIGFGPSLGLTQLYNVDVLGVINVLPETAYGALSALVACVAAFMIYYKLKPQTKPPSL